MTRALWAGIAVTGLVAASVAINPAPAADVAAPAPVAAETSEQDELSRQATDQTASLMAFSLIGTYTASFHGPDLPGQADDRWQLKFQPVIPFQAFGTSNILRLSMPYQIAGRGDDGLEDVTLFDLVVFNQDWGRWGVGPVMTASTDDDAPDDFVIGPAVGGVWQVSKRLNLGLFSQNVFGGNTSISQLQPIAAYQLGDGWSLSLGDLQIVYDWREDEFLSVPIGVQLGKVAQVAGQPMRFAINPQYNLRDKDACCSPRPSWCPRAEPGAMAARFMLERKPRCRPDTHSIGAGKPEPRPIATRESDRMPKHLRVAPSADPVPRRRAVADRPSSGCPRTQERCAGSGWRQQRPDAASDWGPRFNVTLLFPK